MVNLIIQNSRLYYIFDMRRNYGFNIQNIRKIHLLGLWENSLEISRNCSVGPLFSKFDWWVPMTCGYNPYFIFGSNTYFLRRDIDF